MVWKEKGNRKEKNKLKDFLLKGAADMLFPARPGSRCLSLDTSARALARRCL